MDATVSMEKGAASAPFYLSQGDECDVFEAAHRNGLPVLLKGPTGCFTGLDDFAAWHSAISTRLWKRARM